MFKKTQNDDYLDAQVQASTLSSNSQFIEEKTEYGTDLIKALVEQYSEAGTVALKNVANTTGCLNEPEIEIGKTKLMLGKFIINECMFPRFMKKGQEDFISGLADDISLNIALSKNRRGGFLKSFTQQVRKIFTAKTKNTGEE